MTPARLTRRVPARITDVITVSWLAFFVIVEIDGRLLGGDPLGRRVRVVDLSDRRTALLFAVVTIAYEVLPVLFAGATLGKALFGLRVVDADSAARPGVLAAASRWLLTFGLVFVPIVGGYLLLIAVAPALVLRSGRGLHDRLAGTAVVEVADPGARSRRSATGRLGPDPEEP